MMIRRRFASVTQGVLNVTRAESASHSSGSPSRNTGQLLELPYYSNDLWVIIIAVRESSRCPSTRCCSNITFKTNENPQIFFFLFFSSAKKNGFEGQFDIYIGTEKRNESCKMFVGIRVRVGQCHCAPKPHVRIHHHQHGGGVATIFIFFHFK